MQPQAIRAAAAVPGTSFNVGRPAIMVTRRGETVSVDNELTVRLDKICAGCGALSHKVCMPPLQCKNLVRGSLCCPSKNPLVSLLRHVQLH